VPANVANTAAAAAEALEDAEDIRAALAALADPAPSIPMSEILAEYADDLAAYPEAPTNGEQIHRRVASCRA